MKIPLEAIESTLFGAGRASALDASITAARNMADEVGSKFRIKTAVHVRDWRPEDNARINQVADKLGLDKFDQSGITKVMDADGFGVVGYSQISPGWTRNVDGRVSSRAGEIDIVGVLPEFRHRSPLLLRSMTDDMREAGGNWRTAAFDDTSGKMINYFEKHGIIDVERRYHGLSGRGQHPNTIYTFRVNSDAEAAMARKSIDAETIIRPAVEGDAERLSHIAEKYGVGWSDFFIEQTKVAEADGHGVVGFARTASDKNKILSMGISQQFRLSSEALVGEVARGMRKPTESVELTGHHYTAGSVLNQLQRNGKIDILAADRYAPLTRYQFRLRD